MKVKGAIISSVQGFIKENFPNRYDEWLQRLPETSYKIYTNPVLATEWYSYQEGLIVPSEVLSEMFYNGDVQKSSWKVGRYSAEVGLKGIYKVFVLIATPQFIMKRGGKILASFYQPSILKVKNERKKGVDIHITEFPEATPIAENRIGGWMEQALEICGVSNIDIKMTHSMTKGDKETVYVINWE